MIPRYAIQDGPTSAAVLWGPGPADGIWQQASSLAESLGRSVYIVRVDVMADGFGFRVDPDGFSHLSIEVES